MKVKFYNDGIDDLMKKGLRLDFYAQYPCNFQKTE